MVTQYGMSDTFGLMGLESVQSRYLDGRPVMNCSDATGALIDKEVKNMLKEAYDKAVTIIRENREAMDEIAAFLLEKETISGKEFMSIFRKYHPETPEKEAAVETQAEEPKQLTAEEPPQVEEPKLTAEEPPQAEEPHKEDHNQ